VGVKSILVFTSGSGLAAFAEDGNVVAQCRAGLGVCSIAANVKLQCFEGVGVCSTALLGDGLGLALIPEPRELCTCESKLLLLSSRIVLSVSAAVISLSYNSSILIFFSSRLIGQSIEY